MLLLGLLAMLAVGIRWAGRHEVTADMRIFYAWYDRIEAGGGFAALDQEIGNYNAPFLYLLAILTYLPGSTLIKIKLTWCLFDVLLVYFTYRIVALRHAGWRIPALAALVTAFLPTVVVNSSLYGQCDGVWGALALGGLYYVLRGKGWGAASLFTMALAVKPQAIFIFPVLALTVLAGRLPWRCLLAVPVVYVVLDLPAILAGRDPVELLTLYSPGRQSSHVPALTSNAPSAYAFFPVTTRVDTLETLGYLFAAVLVLGVLYLLIAGRVRLDADRLVTASAVFVIGVPFLLPGMHERYFYLADVVAVALAFHRPRLWPVPVLVQAASLLSYGPFLFGTAALVDLRILAVLMLSALVWSIHALTTVHRGSENSAGRPERAGQAGRQDDRARHQDDDAQLLDAGVVEVVGMVQCGQEDTKAEHQTRDDEGNHHGCSPSGWVGPTVPYLRPGRDNGTVTDR
ncbi:glycosyltransferase 87 family protein [Couchioplanes azureus]|uniref:glycosyltransferase 87 family protein n=1 Tax=Couchioplanes caeruleus TaxID=56438 RepID=UPI0016701BA4|nr:glycosyltransferase 87 family protein [Couchioplanes caeruleus]